MSNGTLTDAGAQYIVDKISQPAIPTVDHFILANVPGMDETTESDPALTMPDAQYITNNNAPLYAMANNGDNAVVFSLLLDANNGNYDFNFVGAVTDTGVLLAYFYMPVVKKRAGIAQIISRNLIIPFKNAAGAFNATIPAESWQIDFTGEMTTLSDRIEEVNSTLTSRIDNLTAENVATIKAPEIIYENSTISVIITDYDSSSDYFISVNNLEILSTQSEDIISLDIPYGASSFQLTVIRNGAPKTIPITVNPRRIITPMTLAPADNTAGVALTPMITSDSFSTEPLNSDTHVSTQWQVSTTEDFLAESLVFDIVSNADLNSIAIPDDILSMGLTYYIRHKKIGTVLPDSNWSATISFTTVSVGSLTTDGDIFLGDFEGRLIALAPGNKRVTRFPGANSLDTDLPNVTSSSGVDPNGGDYNTSYLTSPDIQAYRAAGIDGAPAAQYCADNGYFLGNIQQVRFIYSKRNIIDVADPSGENLMANIKDLNWATSTEKDAIRFIVLNPYNGSTILDHLKYHNAWVLPIKYVD